MKRIALLFSTVFIVTAAFTQTVDTASKTSVPPNPVTASKAVPATKPAPVPKKKKDWGSINLNNRANDHLLIQIGYDGWAQVPDSIHTKGFSRSLNMYLMFDFPFKTDPRFSVGAGAGIGSSSIFFNKQQVNVAGLSGSLAFPDATVGQGNYFKKYKLVSTYLEAPIEMRFVADPEHNSKSWKGAIGVKVGTLLNVHTKGKNLVTSTGTPVNNFIEKQASKKYFNSTRLAAMARIGYGHISLFGQFQINNFIKDGLGPTVHPFSIGITLSGL